MPYDNKNRGSLWKNEKDGVETRPDYRGSLDVEGVAYWVSAWIKEAGPNTKTPGQRFLSIELKRKDGAAAGTAPAATAAPAAPAPKKHGFEDLEDDIPF